MWKGGNERGKGIGGGEDRDRVRESERVSELVWKGGRDNLFMCLSVIGW